MKLGPAAGRLVSSNNSFIIWVNKYMTAYGSTQAWGIQINFLLFLAEGLIVMFF